jgi:hypothetical protein
MPVATMIIRIYSHESRIDLNSPPGLGNGQVDWLRVGVEQNGSISSHTERD